MPKRSKLIILQYTNVTVYLFIEEVEIQGRKIRGVGLGNIFGNGPIVLKKANSKDEPTKAVRSRHSIMNESQSNSVKVLLQFISM